MADSGVKQQVVDKIKDSSNILVTVNSNPSVDELSAALGITLVINKLNKHATAVFSGAIPPAIEFLNPEKTFESTVDSLRDFIIALDKEKADHLRYKVDGDVVKIFITPYRTVINEDDLDFSQGDYNVEFVLAIGVQSEEDLDKALESHGRILHDATVASVSLEGGKNLGSLNWVDASASSYSEMLAGLGMALKDTKNLFDEQISTAFLTGIVAATERFSNARTSSEVMTIAAQLMSSGANQQLIATKLEEASEIPAEAPKSDDENGSELKENTPSESLRDKTEKPKKAGKKPAEEKKPDDGSLVISHEMQGDVDQVADQVAENRQEAAAKTAEDELAAKLAENVPQAPAPASAPADLAKELEDASRELPEPKLQGAVSSDQWQQPNRTDNVAEPTLGGTLNATTEQAAADKQREIDDDRNRTILSHDGDQYVKDTPSYQAPLNATTQAADKPEEPEVHDIFATTSNPTDHASEIQPPAPVAPAPTLAEIDAQNRSQQAGAMDAVHAAFEEAPIPAPSAPSSPVASPVAPTPMPAPSDQNLPPLPPLPDFTTLPPLPPNMAPPLSPAPATVPEPVAPSAPLPPISNTPVQPTQDPVDPGQFRIPGQP